ncbi:hypothetical protein DB35_24010 [Streptomyces abyssalis]|uniref:Uncharacterized protein n=2 Tax=Streptomyces abyssalis TaxID=933944 RepID=A0A1E7JR01_9ACTN|nr:hypothetical protein DB35_24010 [Streptomyces abyssalis]OEU90664.1 hypothetical protein AN215_09525 [Streptomyces abyssalis]
MAISSGEGSHSKTVHGSTYEQARVRADEAAGLPYERPAPPPPPGWHRFDLIHCPPVEVPPLDDPRFAALRVSPPEGCVAADFGAYFGLKCERPGPRLLDAVAQVCAEIRSEHGLQMTDLGIQKMWEWCSDGTDGWGAEIVGQFLLMAADRGTELGYSVEDLVAFLRKSSGGASSARQVSPP